MKRMTIGGWTVLVMVACVLFGGGLVARAGTGSGWGSRDGNDLERLEARVAFLEQALAAQHNEARGLRAQLRSETARLDGRIDTEVSKLGFTNAALAAQSKRIDGVARVVSGLIDLTGQTDLVSIQAIEAGDTKLQAQLEEQKKAIDAGDAALQGQLNEQRTDLQ